MNFDEALERAGHLEEADGRGHTQNVSGDEDIERIADASIDPAAVDPSRVEVDGGFEQQEDMSEPVEEPDPVEDEIMEDLGEEDFETEYEKEIVDQISEAMSVLTPQGGSSEFFSDVMSEFGEKSPTVQEIEERMSEQGYSEEIDNHIEDLEENHLISSGELNQKAYAVAEFASEIHRYLTDLEDEVEELEDEVSDKRLVEDVKFDLSKEYFGRASESFAENSEMDNIGEFISPFDRSGGQRSQETNPLMAFLVAAEKGDRHDIGELTGYASDESASERVRQIAKEGYLEAGEEGRVKTTEAGQYLKEAVDEMYDTFETVVEEEKKLQKRIERAQEHLEYRESQKEAAKDLDQVARQIKDSENMDLDSSRELIEENYSSMARRMSDEYKMDIEPDMDVEVR